MPKSLPYSTRLPPATFCPCSPATLFLPFLGNAQPGAEAQQAGKWEGSVGALGWDTGQESQGLRHAPAAQIALQKQERELKTRRV